jgi:hypothetical protein
MAPRCAQRRACGASGWVVGWRVSSSWSQIVLGHSVEGFGRAHTGKLALKLTDAGVCLLTAIFVPSLLGGLKRLPQPYLPVVQLEGVAPAIFHLAAGSFGFREPVALVRIRAQDQVDHLAQARSAQVGV